MHERKVCFLVTAGLCLLHSTSVSLGIIPSSHPPEDGILGHGFGEKPKNVDPWDAAHRWKAVAENQKENFPIVLAIYWATVLVGEAAPVEAVKGSKAPYFMVAYLLLRVVYAACYIVALAPWRSLAFAASNFGGMYTVFVIGVYRACKVSTPAPADDYAIMPPTV